MLKLHVPGVASIGQRANHGSWFSEFIDSLVAGATGGTPPTVDTSKPVGQAISSLTTQATALGSSLTTAATEGLNTLLETHVGPEGTLAADLLLQTVISVAQSKLSTSKTTASS
jgi:hypothetical protein